MKIIALITIVIGCGFHVYSQTPNFSRDDMSIVAQAERQKIVYQFSDSFLKYAESLESKGIQYKPKEYFTAIRGIDSLVKMYDVVPPSNIVSNLKLIMSHGKKTIPDYLKEEVKTERAKVTIPIPSFKEICIDIAKALGFIIFVFTLVWFTKNLSFIKKLYKYLVRVIKLWRLSFYLFTGSPVLKLKFYFLIRPPTRFSKVIDHVPLFISYLM